jgi:predicted flap endonuclease-1-like 5' DNA nuclease
MRTDYILYAVAIIFFVITAIAYAFTLEYKELWIVSSFVLGFLFVGLGIFQRTRIRTTPVEMLPAHSTVEVPPSASQPVQSSTAEVVQKVEPEAVVEIAAPALEITQVKGVKAKRAEQLKALGISSVEDLANASAKDVGAKLQISPKITEKWIADAKALLEKS